jgi:hypothetical protein
VTIISKLALCNICSVFSLAALNPQCSIVRAVRYTRLQRIPGAWAGLLPAPVVFCPSGRTGVWTPAVYLPPCPPPPQVSTVYRKITKRVNEISWCFRPLRNSLDTRSQSKIFPEAVWIQRCREAVRRDWRSFRLLRLIQKKKSSAPNSKHLSPSLLSSFPIMLWLDVS